MIASKLSVLTLAKRSALEKATAPTPSKAAFLRAQTSASSEISLAEIIQSGFSSDRVRGMQPVPVQVS